MDAKEATYLLEEALHRLKHPSKNGHANPMQMGGIYWRLAKVLREFVDPRLEEEESPHHAHFLRFTHGRVVMKGEAWRGRNNSG